MINSPSTPGFPARIALVCTDPGIPVFGSKGASVHLQSVLQVLIDAGHEVHLITPRPGPDDHRLAAAVQLHRLPDVGRGPAAERERAARAGDRRVAALLDRIRPDLVYERYALWGRSGMSWAAGHGVPGVLEVNAPLVEEQATHRELVDTAGALHVARSALTAASVVVAVSDQVADWCRTLSARPETIMVLPNGVDTTRITPTDRPIAVGEDTAFTVGFVGTLKAWHGVEVLIDAMARFGVGGPSTSSGSPSTSSGDGGWRLLVVGDGPLRSELVDRAAGAGVEAEFTGALPPTEIAAQLHRMDIACAPYPDAGEHYFSPLKVYEYLAAGVPVVASAIGQIPDILDHGRLGRLVTPGDPGALAAALEDLRRAPDDRIRLRVSGRQAAVERHTWTAVVDSALTAAGVGLGGVGVAG